MLNLIPTLNALLYGTTHFEEFNLDDAAHKLKYLRARGMKVFTSAYTISTCGQRMDKIDYVMGVVCSVMIAENDMTNGCEEFSDSLNAAHKWMMCVDGLGSFLAAQVVADLKNTEGHPLQQAPDWWTWSAPGPGSLKGLEAYFGRRVTASVYQPFIEQCWREVKPLIDPAVPPIHMQDFQNCLCEFSKYERVKAGGHARNKYRPGQD
jgi:hypothetical protein